MFFRRCCLLAALLILSPCTARAETPATPSLLGPLGLNTLPNARMDAAGTLRAQLSTLDPYLNAQVGLQIAAPLYIALRQTAEVSSLTSKATRLYPGIDTKLRLAPEGQIMPAIAVGLQSALGARRTAAEYFVLSKRFGNFDFTGGLGWGRLASGAHLPNPFRVFGGHFNRQRPPDGELPNQPQDWFTGQNVGLLAGVEYSLPFYDKISLKADWGADTYKAEEAAGDYHAAAPWSVGVSYRPWNFLSLGTAIVGGKKIMGTLSLQEPVSAWPYRGETATPPQPLNPARTGEVQPGEIVRAAATQGQTLYNVGHDDHAAWAALVVNDNNSVPQQVGRAARPVANHAGMDTEEIEIEPVHDGLRGPVIGLIRDDLESAMARANGSPQEIWRHAEIGKTGALPTDVGANKWWWPFGDARPDRELTHFHLTLDNAVSLSEKDAGLLYRTSLIGDVQREIGTHVISGTAVRLNLADNLQQLQDIRPCSFLPVRCNVNQFADKRVELDRFYSAYLTTLTPSIHFAASAGLLEEMYTGAGTEILYRPYGKTFALGAEAFEALKRDPRTPLALGLDGDHILTGYVNGWYEIPATDLTLHAKVGRYLAGDVGGTLALEKNLDNGVKVRAFATLTDRADYDIFGGATNLYSGIELTFPLGSPHLLPNGSAVRVAAAPLGRDAGQSLDNPLSLYALTEPLSARSLIRHWGEITQ